MAHIGSSEVGDLIDNMLPSRDDKKPQRGDKPDILSDSIDGPGVGDLEGGAVSGNKVVRIARRPAMGVKHSCELPQASIDKRYYFD